MYAIISPFGKTFDDDGLTYIIPKSLQNDIKIGHVVEIPIKNSIETGIILDLNKKYNGEYDKSKIKSIINIKNINLFLLSYRIKLVKWISNYYITPIHNSLNLFFPKNLIEKIIKNKFPRLISDDKKDIFKYTYKNTLILSEKQNKAYEKIINSKNKKILLYGLTGSGKTEIYIKLIKENLNNSKQTLLLIPEIILTNQISQNIIKVFGEKVLIINSTVTDATKTKYWIDINNYNAKIIIGTRSALFYPYNNLGLIIIDEEHDNSYISDSAPRYNSIEVAEKITELNGNKLILASGTPSIKSMYKGIKGEYNVVNLLEVYNKK